eukprot:gb/GFBE01007359.1/.p1 GENE.gb/GFBE01007359.1/~~gb/GFBE01007359.1/.p1  ORF type:complete len:670 (+),score=300.01 gb/GFBE01007359.1/:1-2010(+)
MARMLSSILAASLAVASFGISFDVTDAKTRPVTKVVKLLTDMQSSLESEAKADEEQFEKMDCWCNTNSEEKSKSVAEAEARVKTLNNRVNELAASSSRLAVEIKSLKEEVSKNEAGMDTSMALRKQQVEEFTADEKDLLASQSSVGSALDTMASANGSFLQMPKGRALSVVSKLQTVLSKHEKMLTRAQKEKVEEFVKNPLTFSSAFLQKKAYPDSTSGISGVLTGLKDDFDSQLSEIRTEEESNKKSYEGLVKAKREEIEAGKKQLEAKVEQKAAANLEGAQAKHDIKDTEASIAADSALLTQIKEKCANLDTEFQERRAMRSKETEAVSKAIEVLSADEAHDTFSKTFAFLQESAVSSQQELASAKLAEVGKQLDGRLVTLALSMKLDTFEKVKKAIDSMVSDLKKEQSDEVKQKDWCVEEFQKNQLETQDKTREQQSKIAELESLKSSVFELGDRIKLLNSEIDEMNKQIQLASQNREAENKEFQAVVMEQRQTQQLLKQALTVLSNFYNKAPAFVQTKVSSSDLDEPAPEFKDFKQQSGSYGVMSMLQQLISDAKAMEAEATHAEKSAQDSYEAFTKATSAAIEAKNTTLADKSEEKGAQEAALVEAREAREGVDDELQQLADANFQLHASCDFVTQNFDARQSAREDEMDALQQAKSMLSGAQA